MSDRGKSATGCLKTQPQNILHSGIISKVTAYANFRLISLNPRISPPSTFFLARSDMLKKIADASYSKFKNYAKKKKPCLNTEIPKEFTSGNILPYAGVMIMI